MKQYIDQLHQQGILARVVDHDEDDDEGCVDRSGAGHHQLQHTHPEQWSLIQVLEECRGNDDDQ